MANEELTHTVMTEAGMKTSDKVTPDAAAALSGVNLGTVARLFMGLIGAVDQMDTIAPGETVTVDIPDVGFTYKGRRFDLRGVEVKRAEEKK